MADAVSKDHVEITAASKQLSMENEKAQSGPHVAHSRIVLIPHPSDDPRDPLVCFHVLFTTGCLWTSLICVHATMILFDQSDSHIKLT